MPIFSAEELSKWSGGDWRKEPPGSLQAIRHSSLGIGAGEIYVALPGAKVDGHDFVESALAAGAAACIVQRGRLPDLDAPLLEVDDCLQALQDIARGYRSCCKAHFTGITGSVGKTTAKEMWADVLSLRAPTARTIGNFNSDIGLPLSLLAMERDVSYGVFELGISHPGEMDQLVDLLHADWGLMTRVGPVHIEHFESEEAIAEEKARLFCALPQNGLAVCSRDQPWANLLIQHCSCRLVTVSLDAAGDADYRGTRFGNCGLKVLECASGEQHCFELSLPGRHIAEDALLVIAMARQNDFEWKALSDCLSVFSPLAMRWNEQDVDGVQFINDAYNANPVSMSSALQTFADMHLSGNKWLVLGGMHELGDCSDAAHAALGREVAAGTWGGLIAVGELAAKIADATGTLALRATDAKEAAVLLSERIRPGDGVLLKGSRAERLERVIEFLDLHN